MIIQKKNPPLYDNQDNYYYPVSLYYVKIKNEDL